MLLPSRGLALLVVTGQEVVRGHLATRQLGDKQKHLGAGHSHPEPPLPNCLGRESSATLTGERFIVEVMRFEIG